MGRAKLQIKYREHLRARRSTYMTRWKGLKKKAEEITLLCGVHVLVASRSPEFNTVEFWPEKDTPEFHRIRQRYLCLHKKKMNNSDEGSGNSVEQIPCLPMSSSSFSTRLFHEEMVAMEIKLKEIRERLHFFQADSHNENLARQLPGLQGEEELLLAQFTVSTPLQQDPLSYDQSSQFAHSLPADFDPLSYDQSSQFAHSLPADFDPLSYDQSSQFAHSLPADFDLQQDDLLMINLEQTSPPPPPLPPHDQPIPSFAGFNVCFQQDIHHQFIQPSQIAECIPPTDQYYSSAQCIHAGFSMPLQHGILHPFEQPSTFLQHFHYLDQPTPFDESLHHLVDLNPEDPSNGMLPSDSPLWSNSDEWKWADSIFLDLESTL